MESITMYDSKNNNNAYIYTVNRGVTKYYKKRCKQQINRRDTFEGWMPGTRLQFELPEAGLLEPMCSRTAWVTQ